jgi:SEC-C motif-containing protein
MAKLTDHCACGSGKKFNECCEIYMSGKRLAPTAEALMRSRYTAYTLLNEDYLLATWHPSKRPDALALEQESQTKWIGLEIKRHEQQDAEHAIVEFIAKYKVNGKAQRLHEVSRFIREAGQWFYVDGDLT